MRKYLIAALATGFTLGAIFFSATPVSAQVAGSLWKLTANYLYPVNSLWGVAVPSLANNPCIGTDSSGKFEAGTCSGGTGTVTQINTTYPITGGPITTTGTIGLSGYATTTLVAGTNITLSGTPIILGATPITINATGGSTSLSTTSPLASSNLLVYSNSGAGSAYGVATSTLTASSPLTGSFVQIGSGGSLGCQTASGSQAGCLSSTDWNTFNGKGSGSVTSIVAGLGLNGGTITTSGTIALKSYIATSSVETSGYIPYWTSSAGTPALLSGGSSALTFDGTRLNFTYGSTTALSASGTIYADNFYDTSLMGSTCVGESGGLLESSTYCVTSVSGTWPILSSGGTNPVISWGGLATSTALTAGNPIYATGVNTIGQVASSTFLASIGGITSAITALGPAGQTQTGATQTLATSTSAFDGLTSALQIIGSGNTQTFTPSISGTLTVAGGGTGDTTLTTSQLLYGNGSTAVQSVATTTASCSGTVSCTAFAIIGASPITITGSGYSPTGTTGQFPYFSATNTLTATSSLFMAASGFIGVGTTTPLGQFAIQSIVNSANAFSIGNAAGTTVFNVDTTASSPSLGIGTTTPAAMLGVQGNGYFSGNLTGANLTATGTLAVAGNVSLTGLNTGTGNGAICLTTGGVLEYSSGANCVAGNAGTVTSVTLATPNSTLVLGGTNPVTTSGTINADLNLGHSNAWTAIQTFSAPIGIGTTTPAFSFSVGTGAAYFAISTSTGEVIGYSTQEANIGQITPERYLPIKLATSTGWTGSSTVASLYGDTAQVFMPFTGTLRTLQCGTNTGTLEIEATVNSTNSFFPASSTAGIYPLTTAFTRGQQLTLIGGNPASTPTWAACTLGATQAP